MKSLLPLLVLSVESGLVLGIPYERNGIVYDGVSEPRKAPHEVRDIGAERSMLEIVASCGGSYNLFTTGTGPAPTGNPDPNFDYLSFCSAYNQPTKTVTSTSYYATTITVSGQTATVTATSTSTKTVAGGGTGIATCPIPAPSMICGQGGWGYATNNIYSGSGIDPVACHELCLANAACQSFQVETSSNTTPQTCNLYKVDPSGNNTIASPSAPFSFFARDCPDHTPDACGNPASPPASSISTVAPPPSTTTSPTSVVIVPPPALTRVPTAAMVAARAEQIVSVPWFLQPFGSVTLSQICSCIYTQPITPTTVIGVLPKTTTAYVSVAGRTVTAFVTTVVTIGGGGQAVTSIS
jgi:hypothetical protein